MTMTFYQTLVHQATEERRLKSQQQTQASTFAQQLEANQLIVDQLQALTRAQPANLPAPVVNVAAASQGQATPTHEATLTSL